MTRAEEDVRVIDELLTVRQVSELLQMSENFVIATFAGLPGVQDWGCAEDYLKHKRRRRALRIPRSVLHRVMKEKAK